MTNEVVTAMRASAMQERDQEEARLRKRLARAAGEIPSRQGSIIPATPGSVAPEFTDKAPTKKELHVFIFQDLICHFFKDLINNVTDSMSGSVRMPTNEGISSL